jgi:ADP-ribosylglycohydrolase
MTGDLQDRAVGAMLGGLVGDAMGSPTENMEPDEIEAAFGWVDGFEGAGTDDSAMRALLCEALIVTDGYATADDWADQWIRTPETFAGPMRSRFFVSVLQTAEKLLTGHHPRTVAAGNMASSSSAMCIAPVGIVNAGNPGAAARQARDLGSLIHQGTVAFCTDAAAAIAAAVAVAIVPQAKLEDVIDAGTAHLHPVGAREMRLLIQRSLALAESSTSYEDFRGRYHTEFRQPIACDSRETVPAVFGLLRLHLGDPKRSLEGAANFGRDTDTIGAMVGAIAGAFAGAKGLPETWIETLGDGTVQGQQALAGRLVSVGLDKARREADLSRALVAQLD